jgi:hypothetical protein
LYPSSGAHTTVSTASGNCAPDDGWKYHPKHVEQFPDINKMCNVASFWIYIGIQLGVHPILYISRIRVKVLILLHFVGNPQQLVTNTFQAVEHSFFH